MKRNFTILAHFIAVISTVIIFIIGLKIERLYIFKVNNPSTASNVNNILLNLSYSFITGYLVYLLTVLLPHKFNTNKIKLVIDKKFDNIKNRFLDSIKCVYPMTEWNDLTISKESFLEVFVSHSINENCSYEMAQIQRSIIDHLIGQRDSICEIITELVEYKDYITSESLAFLENLRKSDYFNNLIAYKQIPYFDTPEKRKKLGELLFDLYEKVQKSEICIE